MILYAAAVFVGAFLLFLVQPLLGKFILPWFGGAPGVWTTAMLFFQTLLLGGYLYAHAIVRLMRPAGQAVVHGILLLLSLTLLPITPGASWQPHGDEPPVGLILKLLVIHVGLPYLLLSATSPLMQAWFYARWSQSAPYRLYALSNLGSLLALVAYPLLVEPAWPITGQASYWSIAYALYVVLAIGCAVVTYRSAPRAVPATPGAAAVVAPSWGDWILWLSLATCGAVLFLATTNYVCQDIAVIPLLWVVPLGLYLLTFILVFENPRWYSRKVVMLLLAALLATTLVRRSPAILETIGFYFALMFLCCMMVHGELARAKPPPRYLTLFYVACAAGGALGGAIVTLLCPIVFVQWSELPLALMAAFVLTLAAMLRADGWRGSPRAAKLFVTVMLAGALGAAFYLDRRARPLAIGRNFFGIVQVAHHREREPERDHFAMMCGRVCHGLQFTAPDRRRRPTSYYSPAGGVGLAMRHTERPGGRTIAVVGLGVGTLAAYGRPGDRMTFYEINPEVIRLARSHFTYLADSEAVIEVLPGDARLSLARAADGSFDVLVVDAFSGGAIPVHLITREAFEQYLRVLKPDGVLVVNISNTHLDLTPVVARAAEHFGLAAARIRSEKDDAACYYPAEYVLLTRNRAMLEQSAIAQAAREIPPEARRGPLWTDNRNNLLEVLK